jgi:hypothetical protein
MEKTKLFKSKRKRNNKNKSKVRDKFNRRWNVMVRLMEKESKDKIKERKYKLLINKMDTSTEINIRQSKMTFIMNQVIQKLSIQSSRIK